MIKAHHAMALHFVNDSLSVVAARVVYVNGQFDRLFSPPQILRMLLQIRQHKADDVVLGECFIRAKGIDAYRPKKMMIIITFEVLIAFLTIGGTSSSDKAYMEVSWYL
jgi:hypothetical protein